MYRCVNFLNEESLSLSVKMTPVHANNYISDYLADYNFLLLTMNV